MPLKKLAQTIRLIKKDDEEARGQLMHQVKYLNLSPQRVQVLSKKFIVSHQIYDYGLWETDACIYIAKRYLLSKMAEITTHLYLSNEFSVT